MLDPNNERITHFLYRHTNITILVPEFLEWEKLCHSVHVCGIECECCRFVQCWYQGLCVVERTVSNWPVCTVSHILTLTPRSGKFMTRVHPLPTPLIGGISLYTFYVGSKTIFSFLMNLYHTKNLVCSICNFGACKIIHTHNPRKVQCTVSHCAWI